MNLAYVTLHFIPLLYSVNNSQFCLRPPIRESLHSFRQCITDCPTPLWRGRFQAQSVPKVYLPLGVSTGMGWIMDIYHGLVNLSPVSLDRVVWNWVQELFLNTHGIYLIGIRTLFFSLLLLFHLFIKYEFAISFF